MLFILIFDIILDIFQGEYNQYKLIRRNEIKHTE